MLKMNITKSKNLFTNKKYTENIRISKNTLVIRSLLIIAKITRMILRCYSYRFQEASVLELKIDISIQNQEHFGSRKKYLQKIDTDSHFQIDDRGPVILNYIRRNKSLFSHSDNSFISFILSFLPKYRIYFLN
jgi:hypothetical protein